MSVTVDHESFEAESLGLRTIGQLLLYLQQSGRLVVQFLFDGVSPDVELMSTLRKEPLDGHTLYLETVDPRELAVDVLDQISQHLSDTDEIRRGIVNLLREGALAKAMERLAGCFSVWQQTQDTILKTAQLLQLDLNHVRWEQGSLGELLEEFKAQLGQLRIALQDRDYVTLADVLAYEMSQTAQKWQFAIESLGRAAQLPARKVA